MIKSFNQLKKYNCKDLTEYFKLIVIYYLKEKNLFSTMLYDQLSNEFKYKFIFWCKENNYTQAFINISVMLLHRDIKEKIKLSQQDLKEELKINYN